MKLLKNVMPDSIRHLPLRSDAPCRGKSRVKSGMTRCFSEAPYEAAVGSLLASEWTFPPKDSLASKLPTIDLSNDLSNRRDHALQQMLQNAQSFPEQALKKTSQIP